MTRFGTDMCPQVFACIGFAQPKWAPWGYGSRVRETLGSQDSQENPQIRLFGDFSHPLKKPSKNPPAVTEKVEKQSKSKQKQLFEGLLMVFPPKRSPNGGAREARAPF